MKGKKKKRRWKKIALAVFLPLLILAGITYICISLYFENHYYYHTIIGGEDVSYKTPMEVEELLYSRIYHYSLEIYGREEVTDSILPEEIDMRFLIDDSLVEIKHEQNPWLWILAFVREYEYAFPWEVTYDEKAFEEELENLAFFQAKNIKKPKEAYLKYSENEKEIYHKNIELVKSYGITCTESVKLPRWTVPPTLYKLDVDTKYKTDRKQACIMPPRDLQVINGKVHVCDMSLALHNMGLQDYPTDYMDLTVPRTLEENRNELRRLLNEPFYESCGHCDSCGKDAGEGGTQGLWNVFTPEGDI